jgi:hypothetical protein
MSSSYFDCVILQIVLLQETAFKNLKLGFVRNDLELGLNSLESRRSDTGSSLDSEVGDLQRETLFSKGKEAKEEGKTQELTLRSSMIKAKRLARSPKPTEETVQMTNEHVSIISRRN